MNYSTVPENKIYPDQKKLTCKDFNAKKELQWKIILE